MIGVVTAGKLGSGTTVSILNDVGGTSELPVGSYRVEVTRRWHDYEIGERMVGRLLDEADVAIARQAGTTGYARASRPVAFQPEVVYFGGRDFEEVNDE